MKRYLALLVVIILAAGVFLFEEQHRAASVQHHIENQIPPPESEAPHLTGQEIETPDRFANYADLWGNPWKKDPETELTYSRLTFQTDLSQAGLDKIQAKPEAKTEPVLTVQDREAAYAIFSAAGFTLTFNLKPAYPTPEALLPNRIDPGIGGSFSF